jgi:Spy/CpxP family protein refolding chaperone
MRTRHFASAGEFKSLLAADELDQERVRQMAAEHRAQMDELVDLAITRMAGFHRTLSAEQKAKLIEKLECFRKWHGNRLVGGREG